MKQYCRHLAYFSQYTCYKILLEQPGVLRLIASWLPAQNGIETCRGPDLNPHPNMNIVAQ